MKNKLFSLLLILFLFACNSPHKVDETNLTPLQKLKAGNQRFIAEKSIHPDETLEKLRELKTEQHPFAIVVSCSDSRVPTELVFDQGLGAIFSIRTAGNIIGEYEIGSIEYAVEHLHCKLIVVMGHKDCGAITAFIKSKGHYEKRDHIKKIVEYIENEEEEKNLKVHHKLTIDNAINANIHHGVTLLSNSNTILKKIQESKKVEIVGAIYDVSTGKVIFEKT